MRPLLPAKEDLPHHSAGHVIRGLPRASWDVLPTEDKLTQSTEMVGDVTQQKRAFQAEKLAQVCGSAVEERAG